MPNIQLRKQKVSTFRKIALGTWRTTYDPSVYGTMRVRMDRALEYMQDFREKKGRRLTVTHMMARALTAALVQMPGANALVRFNKLYTRGDITMAFQVVMKEGEGDDEKIDLSAVTLRDLAEKSLLQIVEEFEEAVDLVRSRKDTQLEKTRGTFRKLPSWSVHWVLRLISFLTYTLNLDMRWAGIPKDPFGSAMITNVGSIGLQSAYVPLVPYSRVPLLIAMGAVSDEAIVEDGKIVPGKVMGLHATFDHRIMDGMHAAIMSRVIKSFFEEPYEHFDPLD